MELDRPTLYTSCDEEGRRLPGGRSKLTWSQVHEIRKRIGKESSVALGREFEVCTSTILKVASGRIWKEPR